MSEYTVVQIEEIDEIDDGREPFRPIRHHLGIKAFGMRPFGWRVTTAIAGTLVVVLTAAIAQLLFGSPLWTFVTGLLLGVESLNVVMSRTALLDAHLELWVVVGFLALVLDRRLM